MIINPEYKEDLMNELNDAINELSSINKVLFEEFCASFVKKMPFIVKISTDLKRMNKIFDTDKEEMEIIKKALGRTPKLLNRKRRRSEEVFTLVENKMKILQTIDITPYSYINNNTKYEESIINDFLPYSSVKAEETSELKTNKEHSPVNKDKQEPLSPLEEKRVSKVEAIAKEPLKEKVDSDDSKRIRGIHWKLSRAPKYLMQGIEWNKEKKKTTPLSILSKIKERLGETNDEESIPIVIPEKKEKKKNMFFTQEQIQFINNNFYGKSEEVIKKKTNSKTKRKKMKKKDPTILAYKSPERKDRFNFSMLSRMKVDEEEQKNVMLRVLLFNSKNAKHQNK